MTMRVKATIILALTLLASAARGDPIEDFYARRSVTLQIGYPLGAAYDIYGRIVGRHLGRHIPGRPNMIVQNVPGASSLILANSLANIAPRDGTVIGAVFERIGLEPLVNPGDAKFDGRAFAWLGSVLKVTDVCMIWRDAPAKTFEDTLRVETLVGTAGNSGGSALAARVLNVFLGAKFRLIAGYGGNDMFLAMERGETHGRCGMSWGGLKASKPDWLVERKINVIIQMAMQKHPELPHVPLIMDLVSKPQDKAALEYLYATQEMGRPFIAPPGVPAERVAALRKAFDEMIDDPAFLEDARRSNLEIDAIPGARVQAIMNRLYDTPRAVIDRVEALRNAQ